MYGGHFLWKPQLLLFWWQKFSRRCPASTVCCRWHLKYCKILQTENEGILQQPCVFGCSLEWSLGVHLFAGLDFQAPDDYLSHLEWKKLHDLLGSLWLSALVWLAWESLLWFTFLPLGAGGSMLGEACWLGVKRLRTLRTSSLNVCMSSVAQVSRVAIFSSYFSQWLRSAPIV